MSTHVQPLAEPRARNFSARNWAQHVRRARLAEAALPVLLLALVAVILAGQSLSKPFWYDELITIRIAEMPSLGAILRFHESGMETTSFLPGMLIHALRHLPGLPELTLRLPFMTAYLVTCWCMWLFVRRGYPAGFAAAALVFLPQGTSLYYGSETRAYAFVMMGTAIALAAWQAANRTGHPVRTRLATAGVFAGLVIAILFHFFAIFLFVPFAFAEWMHQRLTGRVRRGMWAAIVLYPASVAIMLPGMLGARHIYGKTFWSKPEFVDVTSCYTYFLDPIARDFAVLLLVIAFALWFRRSSTERLTRDEVEEGGGYTRPEWVLLAGVTLIPMIGYIGARLVLGIFQPRYILYFQTGATLLLIGALAEVLGRRRRAGWAFGAAMVLLTVVHGRAMVRDGQEVLGGAPVRNYATEYRDGWYNVLRDSTLPVVADGALTYLPVRYYGPEALRDRLLLLTSYERAIQQPKSVTTDLNMEVFGGRLGYPVEDYDHFVAAHPDFYLVSGTEWNDFTWLTPYLIDESAAHHTVQMTLLWNDTLAKTNGVAVYRVHVGPGEASR